MIYPFNRCEVDIAMIGNHDLDFGVLQMEDLLSQTMASVKPKAKNIGEEDLSAHLHC